MWGNMFYLTIVFHGCGIILWSICYEQKSKKWSILLMSRRFLVIFCSGGIWPGPNWARNHLDILIILSEHWNFSTVSDFRYLWRSIKDNKISFIFWDGLLLKADIISSRYSSSASDSPQLLLSDTSFSNACCCSGAIFLDKVSFKSLLTSDYFRFI